MNGAADPARVVNLTLHPVRVFDGDRVAAAWPSSGQFARMAEVSRRAPALPTEQGPVPVVCVRYATTVVDLPDPQPGTAYVVSRVLAAAVPRDDLYFPADEVRDDTGAIIGCRSLGRFARGGTDDA